MFPILIQLQEKLDSKEDQSEIDNILENNLNIKKLVRDECSSDNSKEKDCNEEDDDSKVSDIDFDLDSPLSNLLDESDDLDLLSDMMIQPSTTHFQHPRQPNQNYVGHGMNAYRQGGYHHPQVSQKD